MMAKRERYIDFQKRHFLIPNGSIYIAKCHNPRGQQTLHSLITVNEPIGFGSFGQVYKARMNRTNRLVALKQVLLRPMQIENEVDIMCHMEEHCNIVQLITYFFTELGDPQQRHILMAMEYMPMTLMDYLIKYRPAPVPLIYARILSYQLFRGLAYLHSHGICHNDVKPNNLLLDPSTMILKLCDFGNALFIDSINLEPNVCPIKYRAPELIVNCRSYGTSGDIWSAGCVLAEMLRGSSLFYHSLKDDQKQLLQIICLLGTSGLKQAPYLTEATGIFQVDLETTADWKYVMGFSLPTNLEHLLSSCLVYDPASRILALEACAHASYDELRTMEAMKTPMPNGIHLPPLFNFSGRELKETNLQSRLLPVQIEV